MPLKLIVSLTSLLVALAAVCQQSPPPSAEPQVKVNVLNVCTPSAEEQKEIAAALARIPRQPQFADDFEISHGRSTLDDPSSLLQPGANTKMSDERSVASYVRIRREFPARAVFSSVQYSFSDDGQNMVETLVLHLRDPNDLIQVSMEDSASAVASASTMVSANTPANRIRLERFGKPSIALARCAAAENGSAPDQSGYEPLFHAASALLTDYREVLSVRHTVPAELAQIPAAWHKSAAKTKPSKSSQGNR